MMYLRCFNSETCNESLYKVEDDGVQLVARIRDEKLMRASAAAASEGRHVLPREYWNQDDEESTGSDI